MLSSVLNVQLPNRGRLSQQYSTAIAAVVATLLGDVPVSHPPRWHGLFEQPYRHAALETALCTRRRRQTVKSKAQHF